MCHMWKGGGGERERERMNGTLSFFLFFNGLQLGSIFVFNSRANNNSQKVKWCWWCIITISSSPPTPLMRKGGEGRLCWERETSLQEEALLLPLPPSTFLHPDLKHTSCCLVLAWISFLHSSTNMAPPTDNIKWLCCKFTK